MMRHPSAITPQPVPHGQGAIGMNTVAAAANWWTGEQVTVLPIPSGTGVIGMNTVGIAMSLWTAAQVTVTLTAVGSITTAPVTVAPVLVLPAARQPIPTAITLQAQNIRRTAALSTATDSIAPLAHHMSALSDTQVIRLLMAVGKITPAHSTGG